MTSLADMLANAPRFDARRMLVDYVQGRALHVLGLPGSHPLDPDQGLRDVGLDSLMAVELRNELQARVAIHLPTTLAFDYPTVNAIANHLAQALALDGGASPAVTRGAGGGRLCRAARRPVGCRSRGVAERRAVGRSAAGRGDLVSVRPEDLSPVKRALLEIRDLRARLQQAEGARLEPIAIVGAGVRVPGGVTTLEQFWTLLIEGRDAITEVPASRWAVDQFYDADPDAPGKIATRFGGFLERIDQFDAKFFGITPREAASLDPQQRLLLEVAWEALEHAGQAPDALTGHADRRLHRPELHRLPDGGREVHRRSPTSTPISRPAATRASRRAGSRTCWACKGRASRSIPPARRRWSPCTWPRRACALGECAMALAGGVNLMLLPELSINFSRAQMMAPDGRCKTFDAAPTATSAAKGAAWSC